MSLVDASIFEGGVRWEETECVGKLWFELAVGRVKGDHENSALTGEIRTWKNGVLKDVRRELLTPDAQNKFESDWQYLKRRMQKEADEEMRHG